MISPITYVCVFLMIIIYLLASILSVVSFCKHVKDRQAQLKAARSLDSGIDCYASEVIV